MANSAFKKGSVVEFDGKRMVLQRLVDDNVWQLEDLRTGRIIELGAAQLRSLYAQGQLLFVTDLRPRSQPAGALAATKVLSDACYEVAKLRRLYVLAAKGVPKTESALREVANLTWAKLKKPLMPPNWTTLYRWMERYERAGGDISALLDDRAKQGNGTPRFPPETEAFVDQAITEMYLTPERKTVQDTLDHALVLTMRENKLRPEGLQLGLPTRRLVRRRIEDIPAFDRCVARYGRTVAAHKFRSVLGHRTTQAPLERAEIDHTPLDVMVIDDRAGFPLGRPWLTACIDDYSRCILGLHISFEPPSYHTVAQCLKHAFLPKDGLREAYPNVQNEWAAHGVVRELVVDNGVEFHSESLETACFTLGMEIHYSARKTPWFKGKIERFMRTINGAIAHGVPGTTFSNIFEKGDYDPSKQAVIRYGTLKEIAYTWVADVYHQQTHRTLGAAPAAVWSQTIRHEDILLPDDPTVFDLIVGYAETRRLTHKGVELYGLLYNSQDLTDVRHRLGDVLDVQVRVNRADLGSIFVIPPDNMKPLKVPALRHEYARGLTHWQHNIIKRYAARNELSASPTGWLEAKERINELVQGEFMYKKQRTRSKLARFQGEGAAASADERGIKKSAAVSPSLLQDPSASADSERFKAPRQTARQELRQEARSTVAQASPAAAAAGPAAASPVVRPRKFAPLRRDRMSSALDDDAWPGEVS